MFSKNNWQRYAVALCSVVFICSKIQAITTTNLIPKFLFQIGGTKGVGDGEFGGSGEMVVKPKPDDAFIFAFAGPIDVAVDNNNKIYVLDFGASSRIQVFDSEGKFIGKFGSTGDGPGQFLVPVSICVGRLGNIYVLDFWNRCVNIYDKDFNFVKKFGSAGSGEGQFNFKFGTKPQLAVKGDFVLVQDNNNQRIQVFDPMGAYLTNYPVASTNLNGLAYHGGSLYYGSYVPNTDISRLKIFDTINGLEKEFSVVSPNEDSVAIISDIGVDNETSYICASTSENSVSIYDNDKFIIQFGSFGKEKGQFIVPMGVAAQDNKFYISDLGNYRVQVFTFETNTNFSLVKEIYNSGDFKGDGFGDIITYKKGKKKLSFVAFENIVYVDGEKKPTKQKNLKRRPIISLLNISNQTLISKQEISPVQLLLNSKINQPKTGVGKPQVANSAGVYSSTVFKCRNKFKVIVNQVDPNMLQIKSSRTRSLPNHLRISSIKASGDVNLDGQLDLITVKKGRVKVLMAPNYESFQPITGLPSQLPGRIAGMFSEGKTKNALVFQKRGAKTAQSFLINSNFVATPGPTINAPGRIRAMSGSMPVTQKGKTIRMGDLTITQSKTNKLGKVVGPR